MERHDTQLVPTADLASRVAAQATLVGALRGPLARAARWEAEPSYELLEAAIDGRLDRDASEALAARLADDPQLQREYADLAALRDLSAESAPPARRASVSSRWIGVAAALLLALFGADALLHRTRQPLAGSDQASAAPSHGEKLFSDNFESGNADRWSTR